jgi:tRNA-dihydrouridine synthase
MGKNSSHQLVPRELFRKGQLIKAFAPMEPYTANPILRELMGKAGAQLVCRPKILPQHLLKAKAWQRYEKIKELPSLTTPENQYIYDGFQLIARPDDPIRPAVELLDRDAKTFGIQYIDLNFSCPGYKVLPQRRGGELLKEPEKVKRVVETVLKFTELPVSVKIRKGFSPSDSPEAICRMLKDFPLAWITVNRAPVKGEGLRTADIIQDWQPFKDAVKGVDGAIPIIANGQIDPLQPELSLLLKECNGIMIGTGALGNPNIFSNNPTTNLFEQLQDLKNLIAKYRQGASGRWTTIGPIKQLLVYYIKHYFETKGQQVPAGYGVTKWLNSKHSPQELIKSLKHIWPQLSPELWEGWFINS